LSRRHEGVYISGDVQVDVADQTFAYSSRWGQLFVLIVLAAFTAGSAALTVQAFQSIGSVGAR
jgi:hypothetical protein